MDGPTSTDDAVEERLVDVSRGRRAVPAFVLELKLALHQAELGAERHRPQSGRTVPAHGQLVGRQPRQRAARRWTRDGRCARGHRRPGTVIAAGVVQRTDARHSQIPAAVVRCTCKGKRHGYLMKVMRLSQQSGKKRETKGKDKNRCQELKAEVQRQLRVDKQQQLEGMCVELEAAN